MSEPVQDHVEGRGGDTGDVPSLPNYTILQKLAVGGMAEIFVAQRHGATDVCVVKQLHAHLSKDKVVGSRFVREARVSALLQHPHIAHVTDAGREKGLAYLAMEFIPGQDVESMMFRLMEQRKMLPPELSMTVTLDVLEGLDYAHEFRDSEQNHLEIVHRDLSPRNVMVTYQGRVKIIDFGLARTNLGEFRTAPGMVLGTLRYMSPEQAVAEPVDRRSDIYSWSVVLYEMLSGRPLVTGANAQEVLHAVVTQMPPPLSTLNPSLPKALDSVIEKGLVKDRRDRWKTAREMRQALLEAAGPLGALDETRHELIGRFVRELFPAEYHETTAMLESAVGGEPAFEPTRLGPAQHEVTRALYLKRVNAIPNATAALIERDKQPEVIPLAPPVAEPSYSARTQLASEPHAQSSGPPAGYATGGQYAIPVSVHTPAPHQLPASKLPTVLAVLLLCLSTAIAGGAGVFLYFKRSEPINVLLEAGSQENVQAAPLAEKSVPEKPKEDALRVAPVVEREDVKVPRRKEPRREEQPKQAAPAEVPRQKRSAGTTLPDPEPGKAFDDVRRAIASAKNELSKIKKEGQEEVLVEPAAVSRVITLLNEHTKSLPDGNRSVLNCMVRAELMHFKTVDGLSDKVKKLEGCLEKLEDATR